MSHAVPNAGDLEKLKNLLGPNGYTDDQDLISPWLTDWRGKYRGAAAAMLSPASTAEVAAIMKICSEAGIAVVPQGGNSGMVAGATPDPSGHQILLSLRRLNQLKNIDKKAMLATVEAGVILENFHHLALEEDLRFPLTLGGKGSATIGGLIATNAGGTQVLRHGNMRQLVAGLEVVLPDGQILDALAPLKKDNRGYDLRQLFCGSEGTIGIITAATLRLVAAHAVRKTAWIALPDLQQGLPLLRRLENTLGIWLEGFEIIPEHFLSAVLKYQPSSRSPISDNYPWYALVELAGDDEAELGEALETQLAAALQHGIICDAAIAKNDRESEAFWQLRDNISAASRAEGPALQHDVSVPVDRMPEFIATNPVRIAAKFAGARGNSFGHLGDGNIHYHVQPPVDVDDAAWLQQFGADVSREVYRHVIELGGSISAEHGIGLMKRDILAELDSPARLSALRSIKSAFDPKGICNPGKLI
jgi:FAD/FMN-containing dehydrogenase